MATDETMRRLPQLRRLIIQAITIYVIVIVSSLMADITQDVMVQVAIAILSGLIGFVALMFAVGALTYESGAYRGARALHNLVTASRWYSLQLSAGMILAVAVILWTHLILFAGMLTALGVVLLSTPRLVSELVGRSSASAMATSMARDLAILQDVRPDPEAVRLLLNDTRASAVHMWRSGDVEGSRLLITAFLTSIPAKSKREPEIGETDQFKFLGQWIRMQVDDLGSIVLLAEVMRDQAKLALTTNDQQLLAQYMREMTRVMRRCVVEGDRGELLDRATFLLADVCRAIVEFRQPPETARKIPEKDGAAAHAKQKQQSDSNKLPVRAAVEEIINLAVEQTSALGAVRLSNPSSVSADLVATMLDLHISALGALVAETRESDSNRTRDLARAITAGAICGAVLKPSSAETIVKSLYRHPKSSQWDSGTDRDDARILLVGPILQSIALTATVNPRIAYEHYEKTIRHLIDKALNVDETPDWGSTRYLNLCLDHARDAIDHPSLALPIRIDLLNLAVRRSMNKDVADELNRLFTWGVMKEIDLGVAKDSITRAVRFLALNAPGKFLVGANHPRTNVSLEATLNRWSTYVGRADIFEHVVPMILDGLRDASAELEKGGKTEEPPSEKGANELQATEREKTNRLVTICLLRMRLAAHGEKTKKKELSIIGAQKSLRALTGPGDNSSQFLKKMDEKSEGLVVVLERFAHSLDETASRLREGGWVAQAIDLRVWGLWQFRELNQEGVSSAHPQGEAVRSTTRVQIGHIVSLAELLAEEHKTPVTRAEITGAFRLVASLPVSDWRSLRDVNRAFCLFALWRSKQPPQENMPGFKYFREQVEALAQRSSSIPGSAFIYAAAMRSTWVLDPSKKKSGFVDEFSKQLGDFKQTLSDMSIEERRMMVGAYSLAASIEHEAGDILDAARLMLVICAEVVTHEVEQPNLSNEVLGDVISTLGKAMAILGRLSPRNVRAPQKDGAKHAIRKKIGDCEESLRNTLVTIFDTARESPSSISERNLLAALRLWPTMPRTLTTLINFQDAGLVKMGDTRENDVGKRVHSFSGSKWPSSENPSLHVLETATAAQYLRDVLHGKPRSLPQQMMVLVAPRRPNEEKGDRKFSWIASHMDGISDHGAIDIARTFDWVAEQLQESSNGEVRLSACTNAMVFRHSHRVSEGLLDAWRRLLIEINRLIMDGSAPTWALNVLFPDRSDGWTKGFLAQILLPSASKEGKGELLTPLERGQLISQLAKPLEQLICSILESADGSHRSSLTRKMLENLRSQLPGEARQERDLLTKLLRMWNPYFSEETSSDPERWLPVVASATPDVMSTHGVRIPDVSFVPD